MDQPNIALPTWLPWATTACLAALVACLGELWIIEKTRTQLLKDENQMSAAALKGAQNQLEAERILNRGEVEALRSAAGTGADFDVALLSPPGGIPAGPDLPWGVVVCDGRHARLRISGLKGHGANRDYQLWLEGPGPAYPLNLGTLQAAPGRDITGISIAPGAPVVPGCRFILVDGVKGGAATLGEAKAGGAIILATSPYSGKISY